MAGGREGPGGGGAAGERIPATPSLRDPPSFQRAPPTRHPAPGGGGAAPRPLIGGLGNRQGGAEGVGAALLVKAARRRPREDSRGGGTPAAPSGRAREPGSKMAAGAASPSHARWPPRGNPGPRLWARTQDGHLVASALYGSRARFGRRRRARWRHPSATRRRGASPEAP